TQHGAAKSMLSAIAYAPTKAQAEQKRREFEAYLPQARIHESGRGPQPGFGPVGGSEVTDGRCQSIQEGERATAVIW
ncbi:MAG: hypothetical protein QN198_12630, partial [Armatimonadota bacterium]|nr:hypothetical protein [Armatimonadota bacterium]